MKNDLAYRLSEGISAFCRININQRPNLPIRASEMGTLIFITQNAGDLGVRAVELSEYFGIQKSSVSAMINSLEKQGYIERRFSESDKRSSPLFATQKGIHLVEEAFEEYHRIANNVIQKMGEEKCEEFLQTLSEVSKIIQNGDGII